MKYMKLGTRPDTFYTEEATRTVASHVPTDIVIQVNNITYLLHKKFLLRKCGFLQWLCSGSPDYRKITATRNNVVALHDIPGGEGAFEMCAKFCYGISINLSAHNFVSTYCAAKFLRMTEEVEKGNLILKLDAFFNSLILQGWKDSLVTLESTCNFAEWSENLGIIRKCVDSIVDKILSPSSQVKWSYTYTRPGYYARKQSVPKDWWTEDISILNIDLFRCILITIRSSMSSFPCQLIGEALHVYACSWLTTTVAASGSDENDHARDNDNDGNDHHHHLELEKKRKILDNIVGLIPPEEGSVSVGFLIRLLSIANAVGASPVTKAELVRRAGVQLEKATVDDLILARSGGHGTSNGSNCEESHDIDLIQLVLDSFLEHRRRQSHAIEEAESAARSIRKVVNLIHFYLQVVARDAERVPVTKFVSLARALPGTARSTHDDLYKAIDTYLKERLDISKAEKKHLCGVLNCQRLSPEMRAHAVNNERLPLRTVVQILFFEQEKGRTVVSPTHTTTNSDEVRSSKLRSGHHHMQSDKNAIRRRQVLGMDPPEVEEEKSVATHEGRPLPRGGSNYSHSRSKGSRKL